MTVDAQGTFGSIRPEARPLSWADMSGGQRSSYVKVLQAIRQAIETANSPSTRDFERLVQEDSRWAFVDPQRSSRLMFLSGARGTGKTSVYVSLLAGCLKPSAVGFGEAHRLDGAFARLQHEAEEALAAVRGSAVWLEPLDMEPLPGATNLLSALMVRLQQVIERDLSDGAMPQSREPGVFNPWRTEDPPQDVRRLTRDVAIAWDGNLSDRAPFIDLDTYGAETERVERARLSLSAKLRALLNSLADCYQSQRAVMPRGEAISKPVFILPVDDFDLNPARAVDLMHLLRMVSAPRLFILVLGDYQLAEVVFNLKMVGDFSRLIEKNTHEAHVSIDGGDLGAITRQVSANALRKLFPPSQRATLQPLTATEAVDFRPLKSDSPLAQDLHNGGNRPTLGEIFKFLPVELAATSPYDGECFSVAGIEIWNLHDFLFARAPATNGEGSFAYSGVALFQAPPRHLSDLWFAVHEIRWEEPDFTKRLDPFVEVVANEVRRAIEEDERLSLSARHRFLDVQARDAAGRWDLLSENLTTGCIDTNGIEVALDPYRSIAARRFREWVISPSDQPGIQAGDRAEALLILFHDLLALRDEAGIVGKGLAPDPNGLLWAHTMWKLGSRETVEISWPTPNWNTFWEFDLLRAIWELARKRSETLSTPDDQALFLLFVWISGATAILSADAPEELRELLQGKSNLSEDWWEKAWKNLAKRVEELGLAYLGSGRRRRGKKREPNPLSAMRRNRLEHWFIGLACLLAPETGLPARRMHGVIGEEGGGYITGLFCDALGDVWRIGNVAAAIRMQRAKRLASFVSADSPEYFRALGGAWALYLLGQFKKWKVTPQDLKGTVRSILARPWISADLTKRISISESTERILELRKRIDVRILRLACIANSNPINQFEDAILCPGPNEARTVNLVAKLDIQED